MRRLFFFLGASLVNQEIASASAATRWRASSLRVWPRSNGYVPPP